jgi:hypothetical protein
VVIQIVFDYSNGILNAGRFGRVIRLENLVSKCKSVGLS